MIATLALVTLVSAPGSSGAAKPAAAPCETYMRSSAEIPALVRGWLAGSVDERVRVCPQPGAAAAESPPLYFGEGAVNRHGAVCSYLSHELAPMGNGTARRLRRIESSEAVAMALTDNDCPQPHSAAAPDVYVMTYDVSPRAFAPIMQLWRQFSAPGASPEQQPPVCCHLSTRSTAAPGSRETAAILKRLRTAAEEVRLERSGVARIVRMPGSALRRRYALFVKDPDKVQDRPPGQPGMFVIYVQKRLRGPYEVSGLGESN
jgi:hypothetical protein